MPPSFKLPKGVELKHFDRAVGAIYGDQCVTIEGIVSPKSQGSWDSGVKGCDIHCFTLAGWRLSGHELQKSDLTLLRPVSPKSKNIFIMPEYSAQRLSVLLAKDQTRAIVDKVLSFKNPDQELQAFALEIHRPVVVQHKTFGNLVLDPRIGWFEGQRSWNRKSVAISFEKGEDGGIEGAVKTAEALWADQAGWKQKIEEFAVQELLPLKNENWLGENEKELTRKQFLAKMKLNSITVNEDGEFEFWHDDGNLFLGHSIQITGDLENGPTDADIPG